MNVNRLYAFFILLSISLLLTSCQNQTTNNIEQSPRLASQPLTPFSIIPAKDCDDLYQYMVDVLTEQVLASRFTVSPPVFATDIAINELAGGSNAAASSSPSPTPAASLNAPAQKNGLNIQERGVDEPDFLKTDQGYLYQLRGNELIIMDIRQANAITELARIVIGLNTYTPQSIFVYKNRAVIVSSGYSPSIQKIISTAPTAPMVNMNVPPIEALTQPYQTLITVLDLSDRTQPNIIQQIEMQAGQVNARMIAGHLYLTSMAALNFPVDRVKLTLALETNGLSNAIAYQKANKAEQQAMRESARHLVRAYLKNDNYAAAIQQTLPKIRVYNRTGASGEVIDMMRCADVHMPAKSINAQLTNVHHLNLNDDSGLQTVSVLTGIGMSQVYASQQSLYMAQSSGAWWWGWGAQSNVTHIHQFDFNDTPLGVRYVASGKVPGWLLNQFSMSEYQGILRIATTDSMWRWDTQRQQSGSYVHTLEVVGATLQITGEIKNIAPGEQIFSARMIGERGYLVTFRQTDPLFVLDLADPANPSIAGQLKINGFSTYLHPLGLTHLLTIGKDADINGRAGPAQLQLFDVTDPANPILSHKLLISSDTNAYSIALYDHHAFNYDAASQVLAIPVSNYTQTNPSVGIQAQMSQITSTLQLFKVDTTNGFSLIGSINHQNLLPQTTCVNAPCTSNTNAPEITRSLTLSNGIYSISDAGVKLNNLLKPSLELAQITHPVKNTVTPKPSPLSSSGTGIK